MSRTTEHITWACDRCGLENETAPTGTPDGWSQAAVAMMDDLGNPNDADLCRSCTDSLKAWIAPFSGVGVPEPA